MTRFARRESDSLAVLLTANRSTLCWLTARCGIGSLLSAAAILLLAASSGAAVTIATVPIGNSGNPADDTGYGSVGYSFRMGRTEVTNAQYVEFLNAVAASDPYELYVGGPRANDVLFGIVRSGSPGSYTYSLKPPVAGEGPGGSDYTYADKPVTLVSLFNAMRFANWLHNGQGNGDTETGAYTFLGGTPIPSNSTVTRNPGARWVIPTENEWYKAAYYNPSSGSYFDYATGSNQAPANVPPSSDNGNAANYKFALPSFAYDLTDVGAYTLSDSPYGTFDQSGNVHEMTESLYSPQFPNVDVRVNRGGAVTGNEFSIGSDWRNPELPNLRFPALGFRVAFVPEPAPLTIAAVAMCGLLGARRAYSTRP